MSNNETIPSANNDFSTSFKGLNSTHFAALAFFTAVLTASVPRGRVLRNGLFGLHILFVIQAFIAPPPNDISNTAVIYTAGLLMGNLTARFIDRLYIHEPDTDFHRINADGSKEDPGKLSWPQRFLWSIELFSVTRGIGWDWQVRGIPKAKSQDRTRFILVRFVKYIAMYAGLYLTGVTSQIIRTGFQDISYLPLRQWLISITSTPLFLYLFIILAYAITIYSHFGTYTLPLSILCVGLKVGPRSWQDPESWLPNFGSLREAYSVRRFWGYTWHQQLRRITSSPAAQMLSWAPPALLNSKGLVARLVKRYFLVMAAFLVSGCIHACGSYAVTRALGLQISDGGEIAYFLVQGVALMVEDLGCWLVGIDDQTKKNPTAFRRWSGYAITATWYIWSRVALKVVPLALAHGIRDERGSLFAALALVERGAIAVPGNFIAGAFGGYRLN